MNTSIVTDNFENKKFNLMQNCALFINQKKKCREGQLLWRTLYIIYRFKNRTIHTSTATNMQTERAATQLYAFAQCNLFTNEFSEPHKCFIALQRQRQRPKNSSKTAFTIQVSDCYTWFNKTTAWTT